jgi:hypothetical protein
VRITDQGCMMRGYARSVVTALNQTREVNTFIPALASLYAMRPVEVPISHEERHAGQSKYSMYSLIRLNFDLITGFSVVPLQLFSMTGMAVAALSALLVLVLFVRRILVGPEAEGLFTLVRRRVLLDRHRAVRHRVARRIRGPHLRAGSRAAALHRRGGARGGAARDGGDDHPIASRHRRKRGECEVTPRAATRAVVFAYSEVGVRCLQVLLDQGIEIPLLFTHIDDPAESQWFGSVKALGERHRLRVETPEDPNTPEWIAQARAARRIFCFPSITATC